MRSDICIVGGGPAGLSAAIALTQSGRGVTVLDCAVPPIDKACGEGLMPDSLAALKKLGVRLPGVGTALRGIRFFDKSTVVSAEFPNGVGRGLRRVLLHQALLSRAEELGIQMLWGIKNVHTQQGRVTFRGGHVDAQLIVGADGQKSAVRQDAGLKAAAGEKRRFGFRRHYGMRPWSEYVEIYWGDSFQIYVTPVASDQVCVALISTDPHLRLDAAISMLPDLAEKLTGALQVTAERGSLSVTRRLKRVFSDGYALLGDASGSVDAITGEGMCLAFQQASALVMALNAGDMNLYQRAHQRIGAKRRQMAALMLLLDGHPALRRKSISALASNPGVFRALLSAHISGKPLTELLSWDLLSFGLGVLSA